MKELFKKYKELILYVLFGGLTTLVSLASFRIFDIILGKDLYMVTNVISWVLSVSFAFVTNKIWVFESKSKKPKTVLTEMLSFFSARLVSLGAEELLLWLMLTFTTLQDVSVTVIKFDLNGNMIAKLIVQVVVVVLNYIFSKFLVFRKKEKEELQ